MKTRPTKVSIRQPLVLYATVFMILIAFVVLTLASFSMVRGSQRAYRRAAKAQLHAIVAGRSLADLAEFSTLDDDEIALAVSTASTSAFGLDLADVRALSRAESNRQPYVAVRVPNAPVEAYLVAQLALTNATSIAFVEISRMVPFVLLGALGCAGILAFFIGRLLLPPLDALAEMAEDPRPVTSSDGLEQSGAPTEIHEVARRFRQTVRLLNEERDLVEEQRDELERMQESLVRASKLASVGRLAAGVAHEVGNPLAAVKGYLSILRSGLDEPQRSEVLERSVKELDRIHNTIKELLTYARHGEANDEPGRAFDLREVVQETLTLVRGHPDLRGVEIEDLVPTDLPKAVGHPGRLSQVLVNLMLNAAHASRQAEAGQVILRVGRLDGGLELEIEDNGPGVDPDQEQAIFDPFFTTKQPGEGTGLGLAVSRALMEAMDGDLTLRPSKGAGATFVVRVSTAPSDLSD